MHPTIQSTFNVKGKTCCPSMNRKQYKMCLIEAAFFFRALSISCSISFSLSPFHCQFNISLWKLHHIQHFKLSVEMRVHNVMSFAWTQSHCVWMTVRSYRLRDLNTLHLIMCYFQFTVTHWFEAIRLLIYIYIHSSIYSTCSFFCCGETHL